jgi:hypothetical protein
MTPENRLQRLLRNLRPYGGLPLPAWWEDLKAGDVSDLPNLDWDTADPLRMAFDPYDTAELFGYPHEDYIRRVQLRSAMAWKTGAWSGDAVDLWLTLCWMQRCVVWNTLDPWGSGKAHAQGLISSLIHALRVELAEA